MNPIVIVAGTRPEAIKMMPVYFELKKAGMPVLFCSTMQHDQLLYDVLDLFHIVPDVDLGVMRIGQDLFYVTQTLLQKMKQFLQQTQPSLVLVQGDTTSTMTASMAAFYLKIPVGHIEAGLRTHDIYAPFPEEMNRRVVSTLASYHFTPTPYATNNLLSEGINRDAIYCTGNTVVDALRIVKECIADNSITVTSSLKERIAQCKTKGPLILLTMHRRESFDGGIARVLQTVSNFLLKHEHVFCFYPYHPNPQVVDALKSAGLSDLPNCFLSEPMSYQDLVYLLDQVDLVLTDSGGIQEEAISLGRTVLVLREKTERQEGIQEGLAHLVGTDQEKIEEYLFAFAKNYIQTVNEDKKSYGGISHDTMAFKLLSSSPSHRSLKNRSSTIYGDGYAAEKIVGIIKRIEHQESYQVATSIEQAVLQRRDDEDGMKKVTVLGLGYIGLPTSIMLADAGFDVIGLDVDASRVDAINSGEPVIQEPDIFERLQIVLQEGRFKASTMIVPSDCFIIAVPTPFKEGKRADLSYVFAAAASIATVLKKGDLVILESTVPVRATEQLADYFAKETGLQVGTDIYVAHCPERVLPGKIFKELVENDRIVGGVDQASVYKARDIYATFVTGSIYLTDAKTAEMVKLIENSSRDVQIAFAHQVASMAYAVGLNPYEVIDLANRHPRVEILKPTCGVGGHCIAVDPWFLIEGFHEQTQLLQAARHVNDARPFQILEYVYKAVSQWCRERTRRCNLLLMGLTYKPDVDDLRESPAVRIADMIKEHNAINLMVCEPHLNQKKLQAMYQDAAVTVAQGLEKADIIVFLVGHTRFKAIDKKLLQDKQILDFCGVLEEQAEYKKDYLYWPASSLTFFMSDVMIEQKYNQRVKQECS